MQIVRSFGSVIAGLATAMALVVTLTLLFVELMLDGDMTAAPTSAYLGVNLTYSFLAAVAGGWVAARIAAHKPMLHAGSIAAVMLILAVTGDANPPERGIPSWYSPVVGVLGALGALAGGWLRVMALRRGGAAAGTD